MSDLYEDIHTKEGQFSFGENWKSYLELFSEERLEEAKKSIVDLTGRSSLEGCRFLDIGCGSGLFSLSAYLLGAKVTSVDIDQSSIDCCLSLKAKAEADDARWTVRRGSALDASFVESLGTHDIVYSWGVLHHTGSMWPALKHAVQRVEKPGLFIVALYNKTDPLFISQAWNVIKMMYNKSPQFGQSLFMIMYGFLFWALRFKGNIAAFQRYKRDYQSSRGMHYTHDVKDWLGGYPYEVASVQDMENFAAEHGARLRVASRVKATESGCNEFVLEW